MANRKLFKRVVCLANSRKLAGRCIAGREWGGERVGDWLRPISDREHGEVSEYERQYEDGSDPKVLDIVEIPLLRPRPAGCQSENWLLDPEWYWVKRGRFPVTELSRLTDSVAPLWFDGDSTYEGCNDRVREAQLTSLDSSLRFIAVERLGLEVFAPGEAFGNSKRRVQGRFQHAGEDYWLWVTDPVYERRYLDKLNGSYELACRPTNKVHFRNPRFAPAHPCGGGFETAHPPLLSRLPSSSCGRIRAVSCRTRH